jgi:hypothetical protein
MANNGIIPHEKHCTKLQMHAVTFKGLMFTPNKKNINNQEGKEI